MSGWTAVRLPCFPSATTCISVMMMLNYSGGCSAPCCMAEHASANRPGTEVASVEAGYRWLQGSWSGWGEILCIQYLATIRVSVPLPSIHLMPVPDRVCKFDMRGNTVLALTVVLDAEPPTVQPTT